MYRDEAQLGAKCNVLIAEDCPDSQEIFSHVLRKLGADITCVNNGKDCVDLALKAEKENRAFDIILMDLQMPVMNGHEAAQTLRQSGYKFPILAMTALCDYRAEKDSEVAGCNGHISKLSGMKGMLSAVKNQLTKARSSSIEIPVLPIVPEFIRENPSYAELALHAVSSLEEKIESLKDLVGKSDYEGTRTLTNHLGNLSLYGYSQFSCLLDELNRATEKSDSLEMTRLLQAIERAGKSIIAGVPKLRKMASM
ncbi:MAG TPA: response regulator [Oligoflexia bacterium]|nr:response regulator [Oligoflexia bacterium]HMP48846.1 response regulator [Oligoflexia bacterium]